VKLGVIIEEKSPNYVRVSRATTETKVLAEISLERKELRISTGKHFLDHMIEELAWFACMSIGVVVECLKSRILTHTIAEDSGITLGRAFRVLYEVRMDRGLNGVGSAFSVLDEALSLAVISIEGRSNTFVQTMCRGSNTESVEDLKSRDLIAFIEGLSQGFGATIHIHLIHGEDPHHAWESAFRALGEAIKKAFQINEWRKGGIAGIKGTLE